MAISDSSGSKAHVLASIRLMVRFSEQLLRSQAKRNEAPEVSCPSGSVAEWTGGDSYFLSGRIAATDNNNNSSSTLVRHCHKGSSNSQRPSKRPKSGVGGEELGGSRSIDMNMVPDEILIAIFASVPSARERSSCASVCKRWLMLLTHMRRNDFLGHQDQQTSDDSDGSVNQLNKALMRAEEVVKLEKQPLWAIGDLTRCLEGKKATDVRLAAIAVGTAAYGGLDKLTIKGGTGERSAKGVTDLGLTTIGICCNALRSLTLWDCPNIGNRSLESIGQGCRLLHSLEIQNCPNITDSGMQAIAKGCLLLSDLNIDSCEGIGEAGMTAIAENCSNLLILSISRCSKIGNQAIVSVIKFCCSLKKLKLESIGISDYGLIFLSHQCKSLTKLVLSGLDKVTRNGFITFALSETLKFLKVLVLNGCPEISDEFLSSLGKSFNDLFRLCLVDCDNVSDKGLDEFVSGCKSLKRLQIENCPGVTYDGLASILKSTRRTLRTLHISKCLGMTDSNLVSQVSDPFPSLKSLSITHSERVGDRCLKLAGQLFPGILYLDLSGLTNLSDQGLIDFLYYSGASLISLNLSHCVKVTDEGILAVARSCEELETVILHGCRNVTDKSVGSLTSKCRSLEELDVSKCRITDDGVIAVVISVGPVLKTLSLAGCEMITDESLPTIQKMCDSLVALNLKNCSGLSAEAVRKFESEMGKRCDRLVL